MWYRLKAGSWQSQFCYPMTIATDKRETAYTLGVPRGACKLVLENDPPELERWTPKIQAMCTYDFINYLEVINESARLPSESDKA